MLLSCFSTNNDFAETPNDTNTVESQNRISKGSSLHVLKVALIIMYKMDLAAALQHLGKIPGISTSYESLTSKARSSCTAVAKRNAHEKSQR